MRVTNKMLSDNFLRDMRTNLSNLSTIQGQISSGKEIRKPSDDPAKASKIMQINSDIAANTQYNTNIKDTTNWLDLTDTSLGHVGDALTRIQELLQSTGNAGYTSDERIAIKDEINQKVATISQSLNATFDGKYLFGGTNATSKPSETKVVDGNTKLTSNIVPKAITKLVSTGPTSTELRYAGTTVIAPATFNMSINGVTMPVTITSDITSGTTSMTAAASTLQNDIGTAITVANTAITADNAANGKSTALISTPTVTSTDDGGYTIAPADTMTFSDDAVGKTVTKDLGLSQGSNKVFVEISQGVTMDYNITASQVINYGTDDNNLMKLLSNITSHLSSNTASDISALTNGDLTGVKDAMTNLLSLRSQVGAKQNSMESAAARNDDQNYNMTEILSTTQDIDITEKAMEYATMQNVYTASLQTSAKVLQPTLLDYL